MKKTASHSNPATNASRRRIDAPPLPDRCVIVFPGNNIEMPVIFKSWIYGKSEEPISAKPRGKQHNTTTSNQGMIAALRG